MEQYNSPDKVWGETHQTRYTGWAKLTDNIIIDSILPNKTKIS